MMILERFSVSHSLVRCHVGKPEHIWAASTKDVDVAKGARDTKTAPLPSRKFLDGLGNEHTY
jgi:hypothetical protein